MIAGHRVIHLRTPTGACGLSGAVLQVDCGSMRRVYRSFFPAVVVFVVWGIIWPAGAQFPSFGNNNPKKVVEASSVWSATGVKSGGQITLAVVLEIRPPYHVGPPVTKQGFIPTVVRLADGPPFVRSSTALFPEPHDFQFGPEGAKETIQVLSGRTVVFVPLAVTADASPGKYPVSIEVSYQACDESVCLLPASLTHRAELEVVGPNITVQAAHAEVFAGLKEIKEQLNIPFFGLDFKIEPARFWLLLLVAAVGGFLLNLTPCVLPLIPIKMMSLSQSAGNRRRCFTLGLAMSLGVIVFWIGLATAIATISGFNATNKLFQYPAFTLGVGIIICVMAIGMSGLFSIQLPQWVYRVNPSQESLFGSVLFGVMTAVLSTPCTAPFMGAAAAWSATQAPVITLATFAAIGLGMALPYLVLSAFPGMVRRVPKSGPSSDLVKQVMGLLMLAAGAYFLGTGLAGILAQPPDPPSSLYWWVVALFIAAAGAWLFWRTLRLASSPLNRVFFSVVGVVLVGLAIFIGVRFTRGSPVDWVYFTPERFEKARQEGKIVVLEFTAAWCLNCHALEQAVLHHPEVVTALNRDEVAPIKVDITGNNPAGDKKLLESGRRSIPYLVIYAPNGDEIFASDAYTVDQLLGVLNPRLTGAKVDPAVDKGK